MQTAIVRSIVAVIMALSFASAPLSGGPVAALGSGSVCTSSGPASAAYSVTICLTSPASGATLTGNATTTATVSVSPAGSNPGVRRVIFYVDGAYTLSDFESAFTFLLPSNRWVDGSHTIAAEVWMRDGFTSQQVSMPVTFSNGVVTPPVNGNQFQPTSGTTPSSGAPFVVAATGDGASGEATAGNVADMVTSLNPNLFLYLGDVYEKGSTSEFLNWYGTSSTLFGRLRSITDPTIGNHEYTSGAAPGYFDYWDNIPNYYSYNAGGWHFVSLNSNSSNIRVGVGSPEYQWLQQDLAAVPPQMCTIVYYHHPLFNIGPEGPTTAMSDIWSLMAQYGVDIVLNGHDHDYQRWVPLDGNGNPAANGITEFVAGAGGHSMQQPTLADSRVAYSNSISPTAFGVLLLQLNASGASFSYHTSSGTILDSGVVPCVQQSGDSLPPTTPSNFHGSASSSAQVDLSWSASTDNTAVEGYTVYRDGLAITTVPAAQLSYSDTGLSASTVYNYALDAFDASGNHSPVTASVPVATAGAYNFRAVADAYVNASSPGSNYGTSTTLRADGSPDTHSYLRFSITGLGGGQITKAQLMVYANTNSVSGIRALAVANNTWDEKTVTYSNAPLLGVVLQSSAGFKSGNYVALDVSPYVTGEGSYSFGLTTSGSTALTFQSKEAASNPPLLVLSVAATSTPTPAPSATPTATPTATDMPTIAPTATATLLPAPSSTPTSVPTATPTTSQQTVTFFPDADAYVNAGNPTGNYGSATSLRAANSPDLHTYLRFTVSGLNGLPIKRVRLLFYMNSSASSGMQALAVADNTWVEKTITYANAPALGSAIATSGALTIGTWVTLDVTAYVPAEGTYSFGITKPGTTAINFASRETGANAPELIVDAGP